jgi:hypothetical protein
MNAGWTRRACRRRFRPRAAAATAPVADAAGADSGRAPLHHVGQLQHIVKSR